MGTGTRVSQVTAGALGFFTVVALVATWPLALHPGRTIAGGLADPLLNTTILAWDADRIRHGFAGLWDPPFLYPHRHTLAYSEHLLGIAIFTAPIDWVSHNSVFAYNVAYMASYVLAGFGMFLLVRTLIGRVDAALLAGLVFALTPYRLAQSTHLQVLMNGWMPVGLWALHNYFATARRRWMAAFGAAFALAGLSDGYYFYFFVVPVLVVSIVEFARTPWPRGRIVVDFAVAAAAVLLVVAPVAWVYLQLQRELGFARTEEDLGGLSARLGDYFRVPQGGWDWRGLLTVGAGERELFPGFVAMAFAALGALVVRTRTVATYAAITVLAIWLSMGPGGGPVYLWLFNHLPGFNGLRVAARFSTVGALGLAVLAGAGFAWVLARLPRVAGVAWASAIGGIVLLEGQHGVGLSAVPDMVQRSWDRVAYDWLRASPPGATLELTITQQDDFHPFTTGYQLAAMRHRHPILNGYSGFKSALQEWLGGPSSPLIEPGELGDTLRGLRAIGVRYVLLHDATFPTERDAGTLAERIRSTPGTIVEEHRFGGTWAWRLADAPPAPASQAFTLVDLKSVVADASQQRSRLEFLVDGDLDTRWVSGGPQNGGEWLELRFDHPIDVARIALVTGGRSQLDYPRHLVIESTNEERSMPLFDGSIVAKLVEAVALNERYPEVDVDLPPNQSAAIRLRQTAESDRWWSVHELRVWKR